MPQNSISAGHCINRSINSCSIKTPSPEGEGGDEGKYRAEIFTAISTPAFFSKLPASRYTHYSKFQQGFTLLELMIVVFILSVTAVVAIPNLSTTDSYKLDKAGSELADAIRFARAEAIRTGSPHGVWYFSSASTISVYRVVYYTILGFPIPTPTYDIRHPVDKKLYNLDYSNNGNQAPVELRSVALQYGGNDTNREYIAFGPSGTPRYLSGSTYQMLDNANIVLAYGGQIRTVNVSPMTGRVTVQ